jgi:hypothetical protein
MLQVDLVKGDNRVKLKYVAEKENMNGEVNQLIDYARLSKTTR